MDVTLFTVVGAAVGALCVLVYRLRRLRLFQHIYDNSGADDAVKIITAMGGLGPGTRKRDDDQAKQLDAAPEPDDPADDAPPGPTHESDPGPRARGRVFRFKFRR